MHQPAIVLVRPQLGENIGKAARAMLNFGLTDLRLVAPRDGWPNPDAGPTASGADEVLDRAQVFDTLSDALADCNLTFATTVRPRGIIKEVVTPKDAAERTRALEAKTGRAAFVFGPERSGLENDDVAQSDAIVTVPVNPNFGSLNLAQAVILMAYEYSQMPLATPSDEAALLPAAKAELDGLYGQMESALDARGYFFPENRADLMRRTLRNILERAGFSGQEVQTLRGIVKQLLRAPNGEA
ncbi:MAG: RNA methyltransferase [Pseudomonadota bacterium]